MHPSRAHRSYEPLLRLNPEAFVAALEAKGEDLTLAGGPLARSRARSIC